MTRPSYSPVVKMDEMEDIIWALFFLILFVVLVSSTKVQHCSSGNKACRKMKEQISTARVKMILKMQGSG